MNNKSSDFLDPFIKIDVTNKIILKEYDVKIYDFSKYFKNLLKIYTDDLTLLHEVLPNELNPKKVVTVNDDQKLPIYNLLYKIDDAYNLKIKKKQSGFLNMYDDFVSNLAKNFFNEELIYQARPTLRVNFPNNKAVGGWHRDRDYNHPVEEINIWVPITKSINTNAIWIESQFDKNDFKPINTNYGQFIIFDSGLMHGNKLNIENKCRISFDFRIIPKSQYKEKFKKSSNDTKMKFKIGDYYKLTRI